MFYSFKKPFQECQNRSRSEGRTESIFGWASFKKKRQQIMFLEPWWGTFIISYKSLTWCPSSLSVSYCPLLQNYFCIFPLPAAFNLLCDRCGPVASGHSPDVWLELEATAHTNQSQTRPAVVADGRAASGSSTPGNEKEKKWEEQRRLWLPACYCPWNNTCMCGKSISYHCSCSALI